MKMILIVFILSSSLVKAESISPITIIHRSTALLAQNEMVDESPDDQSNRSEFDGSQPTDTEQVQSPEQSTPSDESESKEDSGDISVAQETASLEGYDF